MVQFLSFILLVAAAKMPFSKSGGTEPSSLNPPELEHKTTLGISISVYIYMYIYIYMAEAILGLVAGFLWGSNSVKITRKTADTYTKYLEECR